LLVVSTEKQEPME